MGYGLQSYSRSTKIGFIGFSNRDPLIGIYFTKKKPAKYTLRNIQYEMKLFLKKHVYKIYQRLHFLKIYYQL